MMQWQRIKTNVIDGKTNKSRHSGNKMAVGNEFKMPLM